MKRIDHLLLGLIGHGDCSGYDIRKVLTATPMKRYSDSPGSIYPALRRLERQKLIAAQADRSSGRGRTLFRLTPKGRAALAAWLRRPVTEAEIADRLEDVMLRLSFQHHVGDDAAAHRYLARVGAAARAHAANLRSYIDRSAKGFPAGARLALESGLNTYVSLARWAEARSTTPGRKRR